MAWRLMSWSVIPWCTSSRILPMVNSVPRSPPGMLMRRTGDKGCPMVVRYELLARAGVLGPGGFDLIATTFVGIVSCIRKCERPELSAGQRRTCKGSPAALCREELAILWWGEQG